jgi:hypothetical protein
MRDVDMTRLPIPNAKNVYIKIANVVLNLKVDGIGLQVVITQTVARVRRVQFDLVEFVNQENISVDVVENLRVRVQIV